MSTGWSNSGLASFGAMNLGSPLPVTMVGVRVIRKVGERYDTKHIVPTKKYGGGGVMICSCFHANGFDPLVLVDGTGDQDKYINILAQSFHPWLAQLCQQEDRDFILQEDGASCHTGGYARWWMETHQIRGFEY
ncbi:hypothetical protein RMATCC62417_03183 [Rhizopus microsporus]|nr:hypothetical protein RMATCC62417_03183 [Rhizopus microsporus]